MKVAAKPTMIEEWAQLARAESNPRWRAEYAALALNFAELTRYPDRWKRILEKWNMRESTVVAGWKAEGRAEGQAKGQQASILQLLRLRFPGQIHDNLVAAVMAEMDLNRLTQVFDAAAAPSIEEFRVLAGF